jgi:hypothetical protein
MNMNMKKFLRVMVSVLAVAVRASASVSCSRDGGLGDAMDGKEAWTGG